MIYGRAFGSCLLIGITHCLTFYIIEPRTLAFIQFIVQFSKVIVITACRGDLLILTNSEELVKDVFELFSKLNPILKRQGLGPNSLFSISHYVVLSRTKF